MHLRRLATITNTCGWSAAAVRDCCEGVWSDWAPSASCFLPFEDVRAACEPLWTEPVNGTPNKAFVCGAIRLYLHLRTTDHAFEVDAPWFAEKMLARFQLGRAVDEGGPERVSRCTIRSGDDAGLFRTFPCRVSVQEMMAAVVRDNRRCEPEMWLEADSTVWLYCNPVPLCRLLTSVAIWMEYLVHGERRTPDALAPQSVSWMCQTCGKKPATWLSLPKIEFTKCNACSTAKANVSHIQVFPV